MTETTHASSEAPNAATAATTSITELPIEPLRSFHGMGIIPQILEVLDRCNFTTPTPIQAQAIPVGLAGRDIVGIAQTGTGKTLAFGIPMLQRLVKSGGKGCGRGLIILPTRELALQVDEALRNIGKTFGLRTAVLIGGAPMRPQHAQLRANPDIIVATPGRLIDHLQQRMVDLRTVDTLVLDEADRMLDMGFAPQIKQILREVPDERQTMLFSATMPDDIVRIADSYMFEPVRVEVARAGTTAERVTQELFIVPQDEKNELLSKVLYEYSGTVLVFARTRSRAARITRWVKKLGHSAAEIHADRTLIQRRAALDGFKAGTYRVLIATDIAARGIDVSNIELVLNYDLPDSAEDYVHRIGRTARAGQAGHAISFAAPDQLADVREIEKLLRGELAISEFSEHAFEPMQGGSRRGSGRGGGSRHGGGPSRSASAPASRPASSRPASSRPAPAYSAQSASASSGSRGGNASRGGEARSSEPRANGSFSGGRPLRRGGGKFVSSRGSAPSRPSGSG